MPDPVMTEIAPSSEGPQSRVKQSRLNWGLFIVGVGWTMGNSALGSVLLAAKFALIDPSSKVFDLGLASALGGIANTISVLVFGALSDRTTGKWGARTPWIAFGAITATPFLIALAFSNSVLNIMILYPLFGLFIGAVPAAVLAIFPDRVPTQKRGVASAVYGFAQVFGSGVGATLSAGFLQNPGPLLVISAIVLVGFSALFILIAPDNPVDKSARPKFDWSVFASAVRFPRHAPDFYWALAGRFLLLLGLFMVTKYELYLLTDWIGLSKSATAALVAVTGSTGLVAVVVGTLISGPISDRLKRRKPVIFGASVLFAIGVLIPLVWPTGTAMILLSAITSLGLGAFLSVDTALMTEVLPNAESRGKDLGILNTSNTLPAIIAPLATSAVVGIGGYPSVFIAALVFVIVGALSVWFIRAVK